MASAVIHLAVANEVNKTIKRNINQILIGAIAPDISKHIGKTKKESHFLDNENLEIPNLNKFLDKYKKHLNDDFVMGYFIHLYTDYLWEKYFLSEIYNNDNNIITKLDGSKVICNGNMLNMYIYNDYTNLNIKLIDEYNIDLQIFYNNPPKIENIIEEIPMEDIKIIINEISIIIENTKIKKELIFDIKNIKNFIALSKELILAKINEIIID